MMKCAHGKTLHQECIVCSQMSLIDDRNVAKVESLEKKNIQLKAEVLDLKNRLFNTARQLNESMQSDYERVDFNDYR
jgi:hypothetical protein